MRVCVFIIQCFLFSETLTESVQTIQRVKVHEKITTEVDKQEKMKYVSCKGYKKYIKKYNQKNQ